jgi:dTDP-4-amino-4,6-dideoxygalactose transaminase
LGDIGCFSFQSYKMLNGGEGGILLTDDADLVARAVILSGAYEHNWKKHPVLYEAFAKWQNKLPLYNLRMSNLSAAVIRPQLDELDRRVRDGRRNHDHVADILRQSPWITVPHALPKEDRAPDSLQFTLTDMDDSSVDAFVEVAASMGVSIQVFGRSNDNARAFWNWEFLGPAPDLPKTRQMLARACDCRLPARLTLEECDAVADVILSAIDDVMQQPVQATG